MKNGRTYQIVYKSKHEENLYMEIPSYVKNKMLIDWVKETAELCKPDKIYWCDGTEEEYNKLCQELVDAGVFKKLNPFNNK